MGNRETFAARLKEIRLQTGKNQKDFAKTVQSTAATISAYENVTKNPSLEIVMNIAKKYNISIDWLCGLSSEKELKPQTNNLKDIASKILDILNIETDSGKFVLETHQIDLGETPSGELIYGQKQAIELPSIKELFDFFEAYEDLNKLHQKGSIKQQIIDTWLEGALEELSKIPIKAPVKKFDDEFLKFLEEAEKAEETKKASSTLDDSEKLPFEDDNEELPFG